MKSHEIRSVFLDFFREKDHKIVPSAPIVQKDDPTLMFTNAGMVQFKDVFLGLKPPPAPRVANTQKCLRVSGKHNDLEAVGRDTYHHTMFEMLGNWSFGDYFKPEAIAWAWELLTDRYGIDPDRIYITVFEGDEKPGLPADDETAELWRKIVPPERILFFGAKDNFWEMGPVGPCGPCTEIHIDTRSDAERRRIPGAELVNRDHPEVFEVWNLVFIQYNRRADGTLEPLPQQHVDTGMGLERLTAVLQGKRSNYDTDIFQPLIRYLEGRFGVEYGKSETIDVALRVCADHIRAITFTVADGQLPANTGAGYVVRRILRRAVNFGFRFLNAREPFLYELVPILSRQFADVFPEVRKQERFIRQVISEEEATFLRTLAVGMKIFQEKISRLEGRVIPGEFAFLLYDTYGFPLDLTELLAREKGLTVDKAGFEAALTAQKERSRQSRQAPMQEWTIVREGEHSVFVGYDRLETDSRIMRYRQANENKQTVWHVVLDTTPFYPEGGGQVGDRGVLILPDHTEIAVLDTRKEHHLIYHVVPDLPETPDVPLTARVDAEHRAETARHHSATHLLHAALRKVLGTHVQQKGSLVTPNYLRFDFSHPKKLSREELIRIEQLVNEKIRANIPLQEDRAIPFQEALEKGAMALFGEKYGERVRMITFDPAFSRELCGGTHVPATGTIGFFKITGQSAVGAGIRRIVATAGKAAEEWTRRLWLETETIREKLKASDTLLKAVEELLRDKKQLEKQLQATRRQIAALQLEMLQNQVTMIGEVPTVVARLPVEDPATMKNLVFQLGRRLKGVVLLGNATTEGKAHLWLYIEKSLTDRLNASEIIRQIAPFIKGGGGGQAFFASAGGKNPAGLAAALDHGRRIIAEKLPS